MRKLNKTIRAATRKFAVLTGVTGLILAAGINWAEAAETSTTGASPMPGELHVLFLFVLMLGGLVMTVVRPQERVRVRGRPEKRRPARR